MNEDDQDEKAPVATTPTPAPVAVPTATDGPANPDAPKSFGPEGDTSPWVPSALPPGAPAGAAYKVGDEYVDAAGQKVKAV